MRSPCLKKGRSLLAEAPGSADVGGGAAQEIHAGVGVCVPPGHKGLRTPGAAAGSYGAADTGVAPRGHLNHKRQIGTTNDGFEPLTTELNH